MSKTVAGFIEGLGVFASRYFANGPGERYFCDAQHDIIYFYVYADDLPESSEDGKYLVELGFCIDEDTDQWCWYT
jgi:hypothetical protein